ncbi:MAG TPA: hypothetical protein VIY73_22160 [Polyangiaceae bacterium]
MASADLPVPWRDAIEALRARTASVPASECVPLRLVVEHRGDGVRIVAIAPDGRRAERPVPHPDDLVPVALGLLAAPPAPAPALALVTPLAPVPAPAPALTPAPAPALAPAPAPSPAPIPSIWLGFALGVRLTAPRGFTVLDAELRGDLLSGPWAVFATVRSAVLSCLGAQGVDCDVYDDVAAGVGLARRVRASASAVDVGLEPSLAWTHMELDGADEINSVAGAIVELRLDASARLVVPVGQATMLTVTFDLGLSPSLLASPQQLAHAPGIADVPPFPPYWGGLRLGLSRGLL